MAAKLHGFENAEDYYQKASARHFLKDITIPTYILHSQNDPFMTTDAIPDENELSPQVTLELCDAGGHVGFVYGKNPFRPKYWIDKRFYDFYQQQFG